MLVTFNAFEWDLLNTTGKRWQFIQLKQYLSLNLLVVVLPKWLFMKCLPSLNELFVEISCFFTLVFSAFTAVGLAMRILQLSLFSVTSWTKSGSFVSFPALSLPPFLDGERREGLVARCFVSELSGSILHLSGGNKWPSESKSVDPLIILL